MANLSVADVLDRAADLIEPEGKWTQGCLYRDANGKDLGGDLRDAACFCMAGAIVRVGGSKFNRVWDFLSTILAKAGGDRVATYNDKRGRTQVEVVAKLREAATLARTGAA